MATSEDLVLTMAARSRCAIELVNQYKEKVEASLV